jgi:hypothetical protein
MARFFKDTIDELERSFEPAEDLPPDAVRAQALPYAAPRPITASAERLKLNGKPDERIDKRETAKWQTQAWRMFDAIGELHYSFSMIGSVVSRVRFFPALVADPSRPPSKASDVLDQFGDLGLDPEKIANGVEEAEKALADLMSSASGGQSQFLRAAAINLCVPGEFYLVNDKANGKWLVCSSDELVKTGDSYTLKTDRNARVGQGAGKQIDPSAFIARIWRSHPRYSGEPDSTMVGVLDQAEKLVLYDQAIRTIIRTRMNAGIVYVPDGLVASAHDEADSVEQAIVDMVSRTVDDETAANTVVPLVLTGPAEAGKAITRISLARDLEEALVTMAESALDRMLQGIDLPKDVVTGLADVKYANSLTITDDVYRAHIEPLVLMIADSLTSVYLRPMLRAAGVEEEIINLLVLWYDPSAIVTRPDRSMAANEGYDRFLLSGAAWRRARGFAESDEPSDEELLHRLAVSKAVIPPDMSATLIESVNPKFWTQKKEENQGSENMDPQLQSLLSGESPDVADATPATDASMEGGQVLSPGGVMPPSP